MTEFETRAGEVSERLTALIRRQEEDTDPGHWDLYQWGALLTEVLDQVDQAASVLAPQIEQYGHRRILRDDEGWDLQYRLDTAGDDLARLREALAPAHEAAQRYHSTIGHVGVVVDPDAEIDS